MFCVCDGYLIDLTGLLWRDILVFTCVWLDFIITLADLLGVVFRLMLGDLSVTFVMYFVMLFLFVCSLVCYLNCYYVFAADWLIAHFFRFFWFCFY